MVSKKVWQSPKDETPGLSSYLYSELRFRQEEELPNAWKWEAEVQQNLRAALAERDVFEAEANEASSRADDFKIDLIQTRQDLKKKEEQTNEVIFKLEEERQKNLKLNKHLRTFGYHAADCQKMEFAGSGRLIDLDTIECTCGWDEIDTKEH